MRFANAAIAAATLSLSAGVLPAAVVAADDGPRTGGRSVRGVFDAPKKPQKPQKPRKDKGPASRGEHPVRPLADVPSRDVPAVDRAKVDVEDAERAARGLPMRFAIANPMDVGPGNDGDGTWETLTDGTMIWRYHVKTTRGCSSINFGFGKYSMPKGGSLHIYDAKEKEGPSIRPFTSKDNGLGELWTPILPSCDVVIEVNLQAGTDPQDLQLNLTSTQIGYRGFGRGRGRGRGRGGRELSGTCNVDVVCTGDDDSDYADIDSWRSEIPSVAAMSIDGDTFCTGAMVNNVRQDRTPYFLTARHCDVRSSDAASLVTYWNYETSECQGRPDGDLDKFITGSVVLVRYKESDVSLLRLSNQPDPEWGVTYAGWDNSGDDAAMAVAIHHPNGDEKRISFEYQPTTTSGYLEDTGRGDDSHVRVADWELGTTEPGSSGSPLFNQDNRIIGQLHGGDAACGNDDPDWYGKFSVSWVNGLSDYLDPDDTGATVLDTLGDTPAPPPPTPTPPTTPGPPPTACTVLEVELRTDKYPEESSWTVTDECNGGAQVMSGDNYDSRETRYVESKCVPPGRYAFEISDSWGDGIDGRYGSGSYEVTYGGAAVASGGSFGSSEVAVWGSCATSAPAPAPPCVDLQVDLLTDKYPEESSWTVKDECNDGAQVMSGDDYGSGETRYVESGCVPPSKYTFEILDSFEDGIDGGYGSGSYEVTYDGSVVANGGSFDASEATTWGSC